MACSGVVARSKASVVFTTAFLSASRSSLALILCLSSESVTSPEGIPILQAGGLLQERKEGRKNHDPRRSSSDTP